MVWVENHRYADVSRLQSDAQEMIIKSLGGAGVTVVLPVEHEGKVRFVHCGAALMACEWPAGTV